MLGADDGATGSEPFLIDGTPAGTRLVRDINQLSPSSPRPDASGRATHLAVLGGVTSFSATDAPAARSQGAAARISAGIPLRRLASAPRRRSSALAWSRSQASRRGDISRCQSGGTSATTMVVR